MCLSFSLVQAITFLSDLLVFLSSKALRCLSLPFLIYLPTTISLPTIGALRSSFPCNIVLALTPTSLFILYSSLHRSPFLSLVRAQSPCPCRTHVTRERRMSVLSRFAILAALAASSFIECNEKEHVRSIFISPPLQYRVPRHPLFTQCSLCSFSASFSLRLFPLRRIKRIKSGLSLLLSSNTENPHAIAVAPIMNT